MLTPCDSPAVFPPHVARASVRFAPSEFEEETALALGVTIPCALAAAVQKRKAEYVAGRHCAAEAMRIIDPDFVGDIPCSPTRAPRWPSGTVGSITHTHGFASAAVVPSTRARGVGLDTERTLTRSALEAVRQIVVRFDDSLPSAVGLADEIYYALLFSAKESAFKCLHPIVKRSFGFEDVRVRFEPSGTFDVTILCNLSDEIRQGARLNGWWTTAAPNVHTGLLLLR
jgi:enterobactin synthetase component D